ncbi:MAG: type II toxin-antitoxin system RelE/ParE family toxin [Blastocatellales bacterium]
MAYEVVWSPEALDDVDGIAEFIARNSPSYASAVVDKLLDAARKLKTFPFAGRVVPEVGNEMIREKFVLDYRLIYRVHDEEVVVVAVIHGKRLFPFEVE